LTIRHSNRLRKYDASAVAELAERGHGAPQIADLLDIHHVATVRQIAKREGIEIARAKPTIQTIREQIQDMSEREAREHLLFILEEMLGSDSEIADLMSRFAIAPSTAKVYAALRRASPRSLTKDQLGAAMAHKAGQLGACSTVTVAITKLRRVLPKDERIITVWGIGYRWEEASG
jgi:DNA-binding response OmpR family regulator